MRKIYIPMLRGLDDEFLGSSSYLCLEPKPPAFSSMVHCALLEETYNQSIAAYGYSVPPP